MKKVQMFPKVSARPSYFFIFYLTLLTWNISVIYCRIDIKLILVKAE